MRKRFFLVLLAATPLLTGMGGTGAKDVIQPPIDFQAGVVDRDGTKVSLNRVNIAGRVELEGDLGKGNLRIPFDSIDTIEFQSEDRDRVTARVHLKRGEDVQLKVRNSLTFHGQTAVGLYEIRARDLQRIEFGK